MSVALSSEFVEKLAEAAHEVWMEGKLRDGWVYGPETNKAKMIHACLVPYSGLSEADKQSDRDLVLGIPAILSKAGLVAVDKGWYDITMEKD